MSPAARRGGGRGAMVSKRVSLLSSVLGTQADGKPARDPRSRQAVRRLAAEARETLERAGRLEGERRDAVLDGLLTDLIGPIADDVRAFLGPPPASPARRESAHAASTSAAAAGPRAPEFFFYEILAAHYGDTDAVEPARVRESLLPVFRRCMGSPSLPPILALLLHVRLLGSPSSFEEFDYIWACRVLLDGAGSLLWMDLNSRSRRFGSLHAAFAGGLAAEGAREAKGLREECRLVFWRFSFLYREPPEVVALLNGDAAEVPACLDALASQLRTISIESVLLEYLAGCEALASVRGDLGRLAGPLVSLRFQRSLYLLSQPGGPCYPPAAVRRSAFRCLNTLFPQGRLLRTVFTSLLRFTYPYYIFKEAADAALGLASACAAAALAVWAAALSVPSSFFLQLRRALGPARRV